MRSTIPKWVAGVSVLISLLGLFVGGSLYYSPGTFIKGVDFSSTATSVLPEMWASRQIAIALIIGYSVIKQSSPMLKISLAAYCLMTFQDIFIGLLQKDNGMLIGSFAFCALSAVMIYVLSKEPSRPNK